MSLAGQQKVKVGLDDRTLTIAVPSCNGHPSVRVREGTAAVHVQVTTDPSSHDTCLDQAIVHLRHVLDDRRVIDDKSGKALALEGIPMCETRAPARMCLTVVGDKADTSIKGLVPNSPLFIVDSAGGRYFGAADATGYGPGGHSTRNGPRISETYIGTSAAGERFVVTIRWA